MDLKKRPNSPKKLVRFAIMTLAIMFWNLKTKSSFELFLFLLREIAANEAKQ